LDWIIKKRRFTQMEWTGLNELREKFLSFFESKEHLRLPSFPLLPQGDQSLLLINSGMAPMKKWFLGQETPPRKRVTTCQKCIRTPDIENVGKTARHGTFFEMLGNFSFGDYFKHEATKWAWEFITKELKLPEDRLWVSIYEDDEETRDIWVNEVGVDPSHIVRLGKDDNFWEIGAGPCGPCSEIYFDRGEDKGCGSPDCAVGCDCDRFVEFWNLVFSQFDNDGNGNYTRLEHPNIDTGMGLERLACIMQGVDNLFEVDTVQNIMKHISQIAGVHYHDDPQKDISLRVITDHIRSTVFMLADGVMPANEGRGYVLKRLLRRAARHGRLLGIEEPFLYQVVKTVVKENEVAYPELKEKQSYLEKIIKIEEENFNKTIGKGFEILNQIMSEMEGKGTMLSGEDAFRLYDTYGFPIDLTKEIVAEKGFGLDEDAFRELMNEQRERARKARMSQDDVAWADEALGLNGVKTNFVGYDTLETDGTILAILVDGEKVDHAAAGQKATIVLDQTSFYAESGGQVADKGIMTGTDMKAEVLDVQKTGTGLFLHVCELKTGVITIGDTLHLKVSNIIRESIKRNHTAAHLLQAALREVLGDHVHQAGQLVNAHTLRFDFSHFEAMSPEEIKQVELIVNTKIFESLPVTVKEMNIEEAKKTGAMALFGEKYGEVVRVVDAGGYSIEFCGGTHVDNTSKIGLFKIVSESSVAAGVRRIEAKTGTQILELLQENASLIHKAAAQLKLSNPAELVSKCGSLMNELKEKNLQIEQLNAKLASIQMSSITDNAKEVKGCRVVSAMMSDISTEALRNMGDQLRDKAPQTVAVLVGVSGDKASMLCVCGKEAVNLGAHAGKIVKEVAAITGGKGGGKPESAMAGVADKTKIDEALLALPQILEQLL
jgi:alanyl-tRNA synthetase